MKGILTAVLIIFILTSCDLFAPEEPTLTLPARTQNGLNTLGFIIDGKVWTNYGQRCIWGDCDETNIRGSYYINEYVNESITTFELSVFASYTPKGGSSDDFLFSLDTIPNVGTYNFENLGEKGSLIYTIGENSKSFRNSPSYNAEMTITKIDTINFILSGEFNAILVSEDNPNETITISDGRFDLKFEFDHQKRL